LTEFKLEILKSPDFVAIFKHSILAIDDRLKGFVDYAVARLRYYSPVLTGRLKGSMYGHTSPGQVNYAYQATRSGDTFSGTLSGSGTEHEGVAGTNVPYAVFVNYGTSRMGRTPFRETAMQDVRNHANIAFRNLLKGRALLAEARGA
jgi:hypothetical protein